MAASSADPNADPCSVHRRARFPWWLIPVNGVLAFAITVVTIELWHRRDDELPGKELRMLRLVYRQVMHDHVDAHDGDALLRSAIDGMVDALHDDYSAFVPPEKVGEFDSDTTGEDEGVGIAPVPGHVPFTVYSLMEGGPAERAGLAVGDRIVAIDDHALTDLTPETLRQAVERLAGRAGSRVKVRVQRGAAAEFEVDLTRGEVQRTSVKWARLLDAEARLGYLHIAAFQQRTTAELDAALRYLEQDAGGTLAGLVLDLRDNGGGLLIESVAVTNRFLAHGNIVTLRARGGAEHTRHDADPLQATHAELPLVVLVDKDSASASEVVCGALQDHGRAAIVGARTFGKGVVQSIYRWEGLDFRLKLTTSHYFTPNGRNLAKRGVVPDVPATLPPATAKEVKARLRAFEVPRRYQAASAALARALGVDGEVAQLDPTQDAQLGQALATLRERVAARAGAPANGGHRR